MRNRVLAATTGFGALVLLTGCGTSTVPGSAYGAGAAATAASVPPGSATSASATAAPAVSGSSAVLTVTKTPVGYVLATMRGLTVYWFARDRKGSSHPACAGRCLLAWVPVTGKPVAAKGVRLDAVLGTVTRPSGVVQATYDGYPLYTFGGDRAPGQVSGNGLAGEWHVIKEKTTTPAAGGSW
jgi:predicted lipoprotein with Yx(FWY)xxD motif